MKVKDFVINLDQIKEEVKKKEVKKQEAKKHKYDVILENNTDFVLNRKTSTTDKKLVFLISQNVFYIQDNKTEKIEMITDKGLKLFFQQIYNMPLDCFKKLKWIDGKTPYSIKDTMLALISNETLREFYKHEIFCTPTQANAWKICFTKNKKLFMYCHNLFYNTDKNGDFKLILDFAVTINNKLDYNNAIYFLDKLNQSEMRIYYYGYYRETMANDIFNISENYNLNFNRMVEYIIDELYSQGITTLNKDIVRFYGDYLKMQDDMYGTVKIKYPKYLKTEHDVMALKSTMYKKYKNDLLIYNMANDFKKYEWENKSYAILAPESASDIVDEGISMASCVGSYVDRVIKKSSIILFLREKSDIEKSFITIELNNDTVVQIKGYGNRSLTELEEDVVEKWAKEKELKFYRLTGGKDGEFENAG